MSEPQAPTGLPPIPFEDLSDQVTVDGVSYPLPRPFMVAATQNPIEYEGTYPLPEAQLDRFTMRLSLGYPPLADEARMLAQQTSEPPQDYAKDPCTWHWYKDPDDIPERHWSRYGAVKPER